MGLGFFGLKNTNNYWLANCCSFIFKSLSREGKVYGHVDFLVSSTKWIKYEAVIGNSSR